MDTRRLQLLLALSRLGSMRAVAEEHHLTTSTVSAQIAALARHTGGHPLDHARRRARERGGLGAGREGRGVRRPPAGRRPAAPAVPILAGVERARVDLDAD